MKVQKYDWVILKSGEKATIVEVFSDTEFMADIGVDPETWETIDLTLDDIKEVIGPVDSKKNIKAA